jgi:hypothetical protein
VFAISIIAVVGSKPSGGMDVCIYSVLVLCFDSGLAKG